jgi:hypothetical protein
MNKIANRLYILQKGSELPPLDSWGVFPRYASLPQPRMKDLPYTLPQMQARFDYSCFMFLSGVHHARRELVLSWQDFIASVGPQGIINVVRNPPTCVAEIAPLVPLISRISRGSVIPQSTYSDAFGPWTEWGHYLPVPPSSRAASAGWRVILPRVPAVRLSEPLDVIKDFHSVLLPLYPGLTPPMSFPWTAIDTNLAANMVDSTQKNPDLIEA